MHWQQLKAGVLGGWSDALISWWIGPTQILGSPTCATRLCSVRKHSCFLPLRLFPERSVGVQPAAPPYSSRRSLASFIKAYVGRNRITDSYKKDNTIISGSDCLDCIVIGFICFNLGATVIQERGARHRSPSLTESLSGQMR